MLIELWILLGVISGLVFGSSDVFTKFALEKLDVRVVVPGAFIWAALF